MYGDPNLQCDGIWRRDSREVTRFRGGFAGENGRDGISALEKEEENRALSLCCEGAPRSHLL